MNPKLRSIYFAKILVGLVGSIVLVGLPLYLSDLGAGLDRLGYVFGLAMIFYGILTFYLGSLSESSGRLWVGLLALAGMTVAAFLFGSLAFFSIAIALVIFVVSKVLFSLSNSIFNNIAKIRVLDLVHHTRLGAGYGALIFADSLGYGFGAILGGLFLAFISFKSIFFGSAILLVIAFVFYSFSGDLDKRAKKEKIFHISNLINTSRLFKFVLLLNTTLLLAAYVVDFLALPLFQREVLGMSSKMVFVVIGLAWLSYGSFSRFGGRLYDKYGLRIFIIGLVLISITSFLMAFAKSIILFAVILVIDYTFFALVDPCRFALLGSVSQEKKGMHLSLFELVGSFVAAIVVLFFGKLVTWLGFEFIFFLRGISQLVGVAILLFFIRKIISPMHNS